MLCNIFSVAVLLTLFSVVYSDDTFLNETIHIRVKRGKYYHYPSRFYRQPPMTYPTKGAYSYTPPPGYMMHEDEPPYPGRPTEPRPKVSKKPNDRLRDEDINNIVKYLSKQDLDKLIDFASDKDRTKEDYSERRPHKREEKIKDVQEYSTQAFSLNGPYKSQDSDHKFSGKGHWISEDSEPSSQSFRSQDHGPYKSQEQFSSFKSQESNDQRFRSQEDIYNGPYRSQNSEQYSFKPQDTNDRYNNGPYAPTELLNLVEDATQSKVIYINHDNGNIGSQPEESMQNKQISYLNNFIHHEINDLPGDLLGNVREEVLPRPVNLREEDFDISYTSNVPTVVKGPSYKVEDFGDLPLMSNSYKLDTVSSYKVPHYTVTTSSKYSPPPPPYSSPSSSSNVPLEPAPPVSAAKEQSDAHLKAIKIWTHRSQGTAYTLHNDGSLSLERPGRPKKYGP